jgi:hypothetical protein
MNRPALADASLSPGDIDARPLLRSLHAKSSCSVGQRPGATRACFLAPAATYNTTLTALRSTLGVS